MENNLILIEGIPGSGKSTISFKLKEYLVKQNKKVKLYNEGEYHPADLAWNSYLTREEYEALIQKHPHIKEQVDNLVVEEDSHLIVPYTKLRPTENANEVFNDFAKYEVYDGKAILKDFKEISLKRWKRFGEKANQDEIVIFECAFLQNQINEMLAFNLKEYHEIEEYLKELLNKVKVLNPKIIYLSQDSVYSTISRVSKERLAEREGALDWIDNVITWIEESPYGKKNNLKGFEGVIKYFEARKKIELELLSELRISTEIIQNVDYNWEKVFEDVIDAL